MSQWAVVICLLFRSSCGQKGALPPRVPGEGVSGTCGLLWGSFSDTSEPWDLHGSRWACLGAQFRDLSPGRDLLLCPPALTQTQARPCLLEPADLCLERVGPHSGCSGHSSSLRGAGASAEMAGASQLILWASMRGRTLWSDLSVEGSPRGRDCSVSTCSPSHRSDT